jgi:adenylate kinase
MSNFGGWIYVLAGGPGSGKTAVLKETIKLTGFLSSQVIDMGERIRGRKSIDQIFRNKVEKLMDGGQLLPNDIPNEEFKMFVNQSLKGAPLFSNGYPRSMGQSEFLLSFKRPIVLIKFEMDKEDAKNILLGQPEDRGVRVDDNAEAFEVRWKEYYYETLPAIGLIERRARRTVIVPSWVKTQASVQTRAKNLRKELCLPRLKHNRLGVRSQALV